MKKSLSICAALMLVSSPVPASEASDKAAGIGCMQIKKIVKKAQVFEGLKADRVDTVMTMPSLQVNVSPDKNPPDRLFFRNKDGREIEFALNDNGFVEAFENIAKYDKKGSMCFQSKETAAAPDETRGFNFSISFDVYFNNVSGTHSLDELKDGLKDGKTHYKKLFGGPMSVMVPKMTHIGVVNLDDGAGNPVPTQVLAVKNGAKIDGLAVEEFEGMLVVGLAQLEALGADSLSIKGSSYKLMPIPSIKKMKKLGFGSGEDD